ncbi:MAG: J domain-containing protein [Thaumarchaeota archaeon]|nr:J domain-containing protein [Nitrososphaerota archaeon]
MNKTQCCQVLKVSENISKEELKKKFKQLVLKYHPDRNKSPGATEKFIQIKDAYEELIKILDTPITQAFGNLTMGGFTVIINSTNWHPGQTYVYTTS